MKTQTFWTYLTVITLLTVGGLALINRLWLSVGAYAALGWIGLFFFVALSITMFYLGKMTAGSDKSRMAFTNMVLGMIFGKMILAMLIVFTYAQEVKPETKLFLVPFFIVYLIYTIFETWFLMKLSYIKPRLP